MAVTRNGLTPENHEIMRQAMLQRESSNNYQQPGNQFGYIGGYQFGAPALQDLGYVKKGTTNSQLNDPSVWTGKDGVTSKSAFLNSPDVQDKAFYDLSSRNYTTLRNNGVITDGTPQEKVGGYLAAAHQNGAGSVIKNGLSGVDGNGQSGSAPYGLVSRSIAKGEVTPIKGVAQGKTPAAVSSVSKAGPDVYRGGDGLQATSLNSQSSVDVTGTFTPIEEAIQLPIVNVLEKYSSFNYLFTLSSLSADQLNFPETSYLTGDLGKVILSSGGRQPYNRVSTAYTTKANPAGQYDFYIDDVQVESLIAQTNTTKGSNSVVITFKVTEPYSMGQFLQSCQLAAFENDHLDYNLAPFLLTIDFLGYDGDGNPIKVDKSSRYIPINIVQINMSVTSSGCVYDVSATAWSDIALNDSNNILKQDTAITGETVRDCLQKGTKSLEYIINTRLQEIAGDKETNAKYLPNEIAIIFPKNVVVVGEETDSNKPENDSGATAERGDNNAVTTKLTLTRSDNILVQDDASVSEIGLAKMGFDLTRGGQFPKPGEGDAVIQGSGGVFKRNLIEPEAGKREFVFKKGTSIVNAISEIILMSEYCTNVVTGKPKDGFYDWFRIETQTFLLTPAKNNQGVNVTPKLMVFRVVPYKVHNSRFQAPGTKPQGYNKLKKEAVKEYNYIYTGKNVDVLSFDIKLESAFFTSMYADGGRYNALAANQTRDSQGVNDAKPRVTNNPEGKSGDSAEGLAVVGTDPTRFRNADGSASDDYKTLVAKAFQHRLLNSDVAKVKANMTIMGDPYFIADSGTGNFTNTNSTSKMNLTATGAVDYQSSEVDVLINFYTPVDINPESGIMMFAKDIDKTLEVPFSGLYQVIKVRNLFSKGKFTQELEMVRRPNQDPVDKDEVEASANGGGDGKPEDPNAPENNNSSTANGDSPRTVESSDPGADERGTEEDPQASNTFEENSGR